MAQQARNAPSAAPQAQGKRQASGVRRHYLTDYHGSHRDGMASTPHLKQPVRLITRPAVRLFERFFADLERATHALLVLPAFHLELLSEAQEDGAEVQAVLRTR